MTTLAEPFRWTPERIAELRKLWSHGLSASRIAAEMASGITRNAVIGKLDRLGLKRKTSSKPADRKPPSSVVRAIVVRSAPSPRLPPIVETATRKEPPVPCQSYAVPGDRTTVAFADLRTGRCKWPYGSFAPYRFCGEATVDPTNPDCPYCPGHAALAYTPMPRVVRAGDDAAADRKTRRAA